MRNRIITAAIEEIGASGIKFTMADLAARLAISKSTLYAHFTSKEELVGSIIDAVVENSRQRNRQVLDDTDLHGAQKLQSLIISNQRNAPIMSNQFILAVKRYYPNEWKKFKDFRKEKLDMIESLIRQGIAEGEVRPINLSILRTMIESTAEAFLEPEFLTTSEFTVKEAIRQMVDILSSGIMTPSAKSPRLELNVEDRKDDAN